MSRPGMTARRAASALLSATLAAALVAGPGPAGASGHDPGADRHSGAVHSLRGPVTDENFSFVMADRFANGSTANDLGGLPDDPRVSGFDPTRTGFYLGGGR